MQVEPNSKRPGYSGIYRNAVCPHMEAPGTAYDIFARGYSRDPQAPCLGHRPFDEAKGDLANYYVWRTYAEVETERTALGSAMSSWVEQGLLTPRQSDKLSVSQPDMSHWAAAYWGPNRPETVTMALALNAYSRVSVSLYDNYDVATSCYILQHSESRVLFTTSVYLPYVLRSADKLPALKVIVLLDRPGPTGKAHGEVHKEEIASEWASACGITLFPYQHVVEMGMQHLRPHIVPHPDSVESLCYTSGTTGLPKAAKILSRNAAFGVKGISEVLRSDKIVAISYLPLAHILERGWELYVLSTGGAIGFYSGQIERLSEDIQLLRPTALPSVPRVLNRIAAQIQTQMEAPGLKGYLLRSAVESKLKHYEETGSVTHAFWDRLVFRKVRAMLGGRISLVFTGSAPCRPYVLKLLRIALSVDVREGYGQTENCAYATFMVPNDRRLGTVGPINPGLQLRLKDCPELGYTSEDKPCPRGEILVRGGSVFGGYLGDKSKTDETFDPADDGGDPWLRSGDVGRVDEWGRLQIIDRVKNLIKLAQGEYIAIERVEGVFAANPVVQQLWLYGDSFQPHLVGVVVPEPEPFASFAGRVLGRRVSPSDAGALDAAARDPAVVEALLREFIAHGKREKLGTLEFVRALKIRMEPFSPENNMLTPTMKIKRQECAKILRGDIDDLYNVPPYDLNKVQVNKL